MTRTYAAWRIAAALALVGCASARTPDDAPGGNDGPPDAEAEGSFEPALDAAEEASSSPSADADPPPRDGRCGEDPPRDSEGCAEPDGEPGLTGYYALPHDGPSAPFRCVRGGHPCTPPPFSTLAECLAQCEPPSTQSVASCFEAGGDEPVCAASLAGSVTLIGQTPFGPLELTHGYLSLTNGFTSAVNLEFTSDARLRSSAVPRLWLSLRTEPHDLTSLVGSHEITGVLRLCEDRFVEVPVRMTVTVDELVPQLSERFEGEITGDEAGFDLSGKFAFERVCVTHTSI